MATVLVQSLSQLNLGAPVTPVPSPSPSTLTSSPSDLVCCKTSDVYGRYLETTELVRKGTVLISEQALVAGPLRSSNVCCVGCHVEFASDLDAPHGCSTCGWPICSEKCADSMYHQSECNFFVQNKIQAPKFDSSDDGDFGALTVLRALILKVTNPAGWEQLNTLEHHNDVRSKLPLWAENETAVVNVIQNKWKLGHLFSSKEEIHSVCGILEVNSFELGDTHSFRGLFPRTSMLAHNCVPNASHFIHSDTGRIEIRAAVDLPVGSPIYITYALSLQGTASRQKSLMDIKFFECTCNRCKDPTELGTHLSTLKCQKCKIGLVLKGNDTLEWKCNQGKCGARTPEARVDELIDQFYAKWEKLVGIESQEKFLTECDKWFHTNHHIPFRVRFDLCQAYGRKGVSSIHELSQEILKRKASFCTDVLKVLDKITPGQTVARAWVLYELHAAELVLSKRIFETGEFKMADMRKRLMNAMRILLEAIVIFGFFDSGSVEYKVGQAAKRETLIGLQQWIDCLK